MDKQFVSDLVVNTKVASPFLARDKSLVSFRNREGKFLSLTLADRTGEVKGVLWDNAEQAAEGFAEGDVVAVRGSVGEYQGKLQIVISGVEAADEETYDPEDMIVRSERTQRELLAWLDETVSLVEHPHLRTLLGSFFGDADMRRRLAQAHGARSLHHAYMGGLLEHTLSVVRLLLAVAEIHPEMNRDLLIAGGLLHDIGKLDELEGTMAAQYTDLGRFVGHTVITDRLVTARIAQIEGFDEGLANLLTHMLLSHHGEKEWGAPVEPCTMEACALHYADNLDARVQGYKHVIQQGAGTDRNWSEFHRSYGREIYLGPQPTGPEPGGDAPVDRLDL